MPAWSLLLLCGILEAEVRKNGETQQRKFQGFSSTLWALLEPHSPLLRLEIEPSLGGCVCPVHTWCTVLTPCKPIPGDAGGGSPRKHVTGCMVLWVWFPALLPFTFQSPQRAAHVFYLGF